MKNSAFEDFTVTISSVESSTQPVTLKVEIHHRPPCGSEVLNADLNDPTAVGARDAPPRIEPCSCRHNITELMRDVSEFNHSLVVNNKSDKNRLDQVSNLT